MTVQSTWTELVAKNPMLIEIARFRRKFLSFNGSSTLGGALLGLVTLCYLGIVTLILTFRADIPPVTLVGAQTVLFTLLAPTLLHSSIAGERERRSWDLLLAAPITKAQIVVGKFIGALSAMGIGTAAFAFPIAVTAFSYPSVNLWNLGLAELMCLSFTTLVCAITIFFSARVKRSFMALGATLGIMAIGGVVIPSLVSVLTAGEMSTFYTDTLMFLHPGFAMARLMEASEGVGGLHSVPTAWSGLPQILVYLVLSAAMLGWAINTLNFAENEVKFIPKAKS